MKLFVEGLLAGAGAVVVAQGVFKYNLTTTILWFIGLGETYAKGVVKKTIAAFKMDVSKL